MRRWIQKYLQTYACLPHWRGDLPAGVLTRGHAFCRAMRMLGSIRDGRYASRRSRMCGEVHVIARSFFSVTPGQPFAAHCRRPPAGRRLALQGTALHERPIGDSRPFDGSAHAWMPWASGLSPCRTSPRRRPRPGRDCSWQRFEPFGTGLLMAYPLRAPMECKSKASSFRSPTWNNAQHEKVRRRSTVGISAFVVPA